MHQQQQQQHYSYREPEHYLGALLRVPDGEVDDTRFHKLADALLACSTPTRLATLLREHCSLVGWPSHTSHHIRDYNSGGLALLTHALSKY
jgi:hypothetical protein